MLHGTRIINKNTTLDEHTSPIHPSKQLSASPARSSQWPACLWCSQCTSSAVFSFIYQFMTKQVVGWAHTMHTINQSAFNYSLFSQKTSGFSNCEIKYLHGLAWCSQSKVPRNSETGLPAKHLKWGRPMNISICKMASIHVDEYVVNMLSMNMLSTCCQWICCQHFVNEYVVNMLSMNMLSTCCQWICC